MNIDPILVVEDDAELGEALRDTLELSGYPVILVDGGPLALQILAARPVSMVISDVQMQPMDGHALLARIRRDHPRLPVVLMTAFGTIDRAVDAIQAGAVDYLPKPFEVDALVALVGRYVTEADAGAGSELIAVDPASRALADLARRVADNEVTVLLTGPSGSGKEMYAREIHRCSPRRNGPFVGINCAAIPENMLEAMLFGYEKGAFTGAHKSHPGKFEQAQGGTLLLDEVSEMDLGLQAKLLRVLQEREVERLGGTRAVVLDVRVLATSNRNLKQEVAAGRFREDLFYRLNVFPLTLPSLAARRGDILPLAARLIRQRLTEGRPLPVLSAGAERKLLTHDWPGNVRELDNAIQRALILANGNLIEAADLCLEASPLLTAQDAAPQVAGEGELDGDLKLRERDLILNALNLSGTRKGAAERLGISPRTLRYKLARLRDLGVALPGAVGLESA